MNGFHVERRFGWDTHGLPVEHEIDKSWVSLQKKMSMPWVLISTMPSVVPLL